MDYLSKLIAKLIKDKKDSAVWRTFATLLACVVVFTTTYSLILPALTVDNHQADVMAGMTIETQRASETAAQDDAEDDGEALDEGLESAAIYEETGEHTSLSVSDSGNSGFEPVDSLDELGDDLFEDDDIYTVYEDQTLDDVVTIEAEPETETETEAESEEDGTKQAVELEDTAQNEAIETAVEAAGVYAAQIDEEVAADDAQEIVLEDVSAYAEESADAEDAEAAEEDVENVVVAAADDVNGTADADTEDAENEENNVTEISAPAPEETVAAPADDLSEIGIPDELVEDEETAAPEEQANAEEQVGADEPALEEESEEAIEPETEETDVLETVEEIESETETESETEEIVQQTKELTVRGMNEDGTQADYQVRLLYTDDAGIPEGAYLEVAEILPGTASYASYLRRTKNALGLEDDAILPEAYARFFDIKIMAADEDGKVNEIQPEASVTVEINYDTPVEGAQETDKNAVHFHKGEVDVLDVLTTKELEKAAEDAVNADDLKAVKEAAGKEASEAVAAADFSEADAEASVAFEAETFSVYGIVYTVDFYFGDLEYHLPGEGSMLLSELFEALGIELPVSDVVDLFFTDSSLLGISQDGDDWVIESLAPFTTYESLTVYLKNEGRLVIKVADAEHITDLNRLLTNATLTVDGQLITGTTWSVRPNTDYTISLRFAETRAEQFVDDGSVMTYVLPEGFEAQLTTNGTFAVDISGTTISGNRYKIVKRADGRYELQITWNTADPNFSKLTASGTVAFKVDIVGKINQNFRELDFSDSVERNVIIDNSSNVSVSKSGWYDASNKKIHYTVTVKSEGNSTNVSVSDVISGTAVKMNSDDTIRMTVNSPYSQSDVSSAKRSDGKGFNYTIGSMTNGQIYTFDYTASVDFDKLAKSGQTTWDETGNTVRVSSGNDDKPGDNEATHYEGNISFNASIKKNSTSISEIYERDGKKYKKVTWKITENSERNISLGGSSVTDKIADYSKDIMKYTGEGIWISTNDGQAVLHRWSELGVDTSSASSWTYSIPSSVGKDKIEITYDTEVEIKDETQTVNVNNSVDGKPGTDYSSAPVNTGNNGNSGTGGSGGTGDGETTPTGPAISKVYTALSDEEITWKVAVNIPKEGYNGEFYVNDWLPYAHYGHSNEYDTLISISVDGLLEGESYNTEKLFTDRYTPSKNITEPYESGVRINFFRNTSQSEKGMLPNSSDRVITITLVTKVNEQWMQETLNDSNNGVHINNAEVHSSDGDNQTESRVTPRAKRIEKTYDGTNWVRLNSTNEVITVYKYTLSIEGVNQDGYEITDEFDTAAFSLFQGGDGYYYNYPTGEYNQIVGSAILSFNESDAGMPNGVVEHAVLKETSTGFSINTSQFPRTPSGGFYGFYKLTYFLVVNGEEGLSYMKDLALAEGGKTTFTNKASFAGNEDTADFEFEYKPLSKTVSDNADSDGYYMYTIRLNPDKAVLNSGNPMTMTDTFENMSVDYTTIAVTTDPAENASEVTWNYTGNTGTFSIPDATAVVLTYKARPIGSGSVTMSNVAEMKGYVADSAKTVTVSSSASGSGHVAEIKLLKYAKGEMSAPLAGAEFELYEVKDDGSYTPVEYGPKSQKSGTVKFVTGEDGLVNVTLSASENEDDNYLELEYKDDSGALHKGKYYALKEVKAPEGYKIDGTYYRFYITTIPANVDYNKYIYFNKDVVKIANAPEAGIRLKKIVKGGTLTEDQKENIKFEISGPNGYFSAISYAEFEGDTYKLPDSKDNLTNLPAGVYTVKEVITDDDGLVQIEKSYQIDSGKKQTYTADEEGTINDNGVSFEITNEDIANNKDHVVTVTNTYTTTTTPESSTMKITLEKKWESSSSSEAPDGASATFALKQLKSIPSSVSSDSFNLIIQNSQYKVLGDVVAKAGDTITVEITNADRHAGANITLYWSENGIAKEHYWQYIQANEKGIKDTDNVYPIPNNINPDNGEVIARFTNSGLDNEAIQWKFTNPCNAISYSDPVTTDFEQTITLPAYGSWKTVIDNLPKTDTEGNVYSYYLVETSHTPAYYDQVEFMSSKGDVEHPIDSTGKVTVKNKYDGPTTDFTVQKRFMYNGNDKWYQNYGAGTDLSINYLLLRKIDGKYYQVNENGERDSSAIFTLSYSDTAKIHLEENDNTAGVLTLADDDFQYINFAHTFSNLPGKHNEYYAIECSQDGKTVFEDRLSNCTSAAHWGETGITVREAATTQYMSCLEYNGNKLSNGSVVALKNNLIDITAKKVWDVPKNDGTIYYHPTATFKLYRKEISTIADRAADAPTTLEKALSLGYQSIEDLNKREETATGITAVKTVPAGTALEQIVEWKQLPMFDLVSGIGYKYAVLEVQEDNGYTYVNLTNNTDNWTFTNKIETFKLWVHKRWYDRNGKEISDQFDDSYAINYEVYRQAYTDKARTLTYGTAEKVAEGSINKSAGWVKTVDNLPKTNVALGSNNEVTVLYYGYYVVETTPEGTFTTTYKIEDNNNVGSNPSDAMIDMGKADGKAGDIGTDIRNTIEAVDIPVEKVWGQDVPVGSSIKVKLYRIVTDAEGGESEEAVTKNYLGKNVTYELTLAGNTADGSKNWRGKFSDLPKYDENHNAIRYRIREIQVGLQDGSVIEGDAIQSRYGSATSVDVASNLQNLNVTITNDLTIGSVKVTKTFDGITTLPSNFKITATWTEDGRSKTKELTLTDPHLEGNGTAGAPYIWTIEDLPIGTVVTFKETGMLIDGYSLTANGQSVTEEAQAEAITATVKGVNPQTADFVNKYEKYQTTIKIVKTDTNGTKLTGAKFQILLKAGESGTYTVFDNDLWKDASDNFKGVFTVSSTEGFDITGLSDGYYKIIEQEPPTGYLKITSDILFRIHNGVVEYSGNDDMVQYESSSKTFTVQNTFGAVLPATGGMGTRIFYTLGFSLMALAGAVLLLRRRREF